MQKLNRLILAVLVLAALLAIPSLASADRGVKAPATATVKWSSPVSAAKQVAAYWTKRKMRNARPLDVVRVAEAPSLVRTVQTDRGEVELVSPTSAQRSGSSQGFPAIPYVREEITDPSQVPYRTHGKVFFSSGGFNYVCSGTVITSVSESLVVTAGHCVHELNDGFSTNFEFVPAYKSGDAPFGEWPATQLFTTTQWADNENFNYDIGMATLALDGGSSIQDVVGARGVAFNQSAIQAFDAFGYPAGAPFNGSRLYHCDSDIGFRDGTGTVSPIAIGCDMTGGSSGGGWVINDTTVNSVVSYGYDEFPDLLFGPYFGTVAESLYNEAGGGSGTPTPTPTPTSTPTVTPTATPTQTATPTPTPTDLDPVDHAMGLTLSLRKHLIAKGRMTALDGFSACAAGAPIEIYRFIDSNTGVWVRSTSTDDSGFYRVKIKDRKGRYFAYGPEGPVNDLNFCLEAFSAAARHRH